MSYHIKHVRNKLITGGIFATFQSSMMSYVRWATEYMEAHRLRTRKRKASYPPHIEGISRNPPMRLPERKKSLAHGWCPTPDKHGKNSGNTRRRAKAGK